MTQHHHHNNAIIIIIVVLSPYMIITINAFTGKFYFYQRLLFVLKPRWNLFTQLPFLSSNQNLNYPPTPCGLNSSYFLLAVVCYLLSFVISCSLLLSAVVWTPHFLLLSADHRDGNMTHGVQQIRKRETKQICGYWRAGNPSLTAGSLSSRICCLLISSFVLWYKYCFLTPGDTYQSDHHLQYHPYLLRNYHHNRLMITIISKNNIKITTITT